MSSLSAGKIQVENLSFAGLGAASIKATNLEFNNLNVPGSLSVNSQAVATQSALTSGLALKANLASPVLTGVPTAPTAALKTATAQIASTGFVQNAIDDLVGGASPAFDTLKEIQTALESDATLSAALTTSIGNKAPLANPVLTGVPTAPTAALGTSTTQLATTAFVNSSLNNDFLTIKGSRKIAKSPFHLPTPRGQYAVDLHNVVSWMQTETTIIISKSHISEALTTAYESSHSPAELVSDSITPDGSGYDVPTKYGVKRIALEFGDCFYSAEKQAFMTPPSPVSMSIFMPSTRDKTEEFSYYDESPAPNYYQNFVSGDFDQMMMSYNSNMFKDDVSNDSVFQLFINYDFSEFDSSDLATKLDGNAIYPSLLTDIADSQAIANVSNHNRYVFIKNVCNLFKANINMSVRVAALLDAIKTTGAYERIMSYKWNVKRYTNYTDTSGVLSTNISDSQVPNGVLPVHIGQYVHIAQAIELASRGIVCIYYSYDYDFSGGFRLPGTNSLGYMRGALMWDTWYSKLIHDYAIYNPNTDPNTSYNQENIYNTENRFTVNDGIYTGFGTIEYNIDVLRSLYNLFVETDLTSIIDVNKVSTQGYSASSIITTVSSIIMEKYPAFPMKFTCAIPIEVPAGLPWDLTVNGVNIGDYRNTPRQELLPNGYSIPVLWMDQNHGSYDKVSGTNSAVGFVGFLQRSFRKTDVRIRSDCIYHEFGDTHLTAVLNQFTETYDRPICMYYIPTTSDGLDYPDDAFNNLTFNESLVSVESDTLMQGIRAYIGMALFVCRNSLPYYPVSKEVIKSILPGTTTISPYTLDDAGEFLDNAVVYDSIKMPKVITMYDSSVYDFVHNIPGKSTYCFDLTDIKAINLPFSLQNLPTDIVANVGVQTVGVTYNNVTHNVSSFNKTIKSYVPHADVDGFADTAGIDFVRGTSPSGSWKIAELNGSTWFRSGDVGTTGTPGNNGSVIMNITSDSTGVLQFTAFASSETGYDFLFVYKNGVKVIGESDGVAGDATLHNISIDVNTGDLIKIAYIKDELSTSFDDVIYIKDLVLKGIFYTNVSVVDDVHPACNVNISLGGGSSITQDVDLTSLTLSSISVVTQIEGVTITLTENLVSAGKLLVTVNYFKIPPADSVIKLIF
jgi:hypothetical protein